MKWEVKWEVKEIEQKWMGSREGFSRTETMSKTERINEGWEEIMKNEILGKGILTFLVLHIF